MIHKPAYEKPRRFAGFFRQEICMRKLLLNVLSTIRYLYYLAHRKNTNTIKPQPLSVSRKISVRVLVQKDQESNNS